MRDKIGLETDRPGEGEGRAQGEEVDQLREQVAELQRQVSDMATEEPLFLYISPVRLIVMSILTFHLYEAYWIYKNWKYLKERESLDIRPFWRGIFGVFYCHSLLKRIQRDEEARSIAEPTFSASGLATGWVILMILANLIFRIPVDVTSGDLLVSVVLLAPFIPSFLFLVPVQQYVNRVTEKRNPEQPMYGWSSGHFAVLGIGLFNWLLQGIGLAAILGA